MANLPRRRPLVCRRTRLPLNASRARHHQKRWQSPATPATTSPPFKAVPSPHGAGRIPPHPYQNAHPAGSFSRRRKRRNVDTTPRSPSANQGFLGGENARKRPRKISHAPSLSWHLQPLRVVPGDCLASGKALKTDARNRLSSSKNRNNIAKVELSFPSHTAETSPPCFRTTCCRQQNRRKNGHFRGSRGKVLAGWFFAFRTEQLLLLLRRNKYDAHSI